MKRMNQGFTFIIYLLSISLHECIVQSKKQGYGVNKEEDVSSLPLKNLCKVKKGSLKKRVTKYVLPFRKRGRGIHFGKLKKISLFFGRF